MPACCEVTLGIRAAQLLVGKEVFFQQGVTAFHFQGLAFQGSRRRGALAAQLTELVTQRVVKLVDGAIDR